jgi:hypothetical protein
MAELHAQLSAKTTELHAWQGRVKEKVLGADPLALNASLKELSPEGNKLVEESDILTHSIKEVSAMNGYLKT